MRFDTALGSGGLFTPLERISLLYFGSFAILVGMIG
jgi:hypothetical protein